jgi:hypothetical protein
MKRRLFIYTIILAIVTTLLALFIFDRKNVEEVIVFPFILDAPTMVFNAEGNNHFEGTPIVVTKREVHNLFLSALPDHLKHNESATWIIGWGAKVSYRNRGVENLRNLKVVNGQYLLLDSLIKGKGYPEKGDTVVFWNSSPSGFELLDDNLINPSMWKEFAGESIHFANVVYDSAHRVYCLFANECDTSKIAIYGAMSKNLRAWTPMDNGNPLLHAADFKDITWCGWDESGKIRQSPFASDVFRWNDKWYLLLYGYDQNGLRNIGYAYTNDLLKPFTIAAHPILTNEKLGKWAEKGVFYPKVTCFKDTLYMSFTGLNSQRIEHLGLAKGVSIDRLMPIHSDPILYTGTGWRNSDFSSESARIEVRQDSIFIMVAGKKKWNDHFIQRRLFSGAYMMEKGNVDISQLGVFLSTDGGLTFYSHINNPILINHYGTFSKNNHSGGNLAIIKTDTMTYLIQQEKATFPEKRYLITLKGKRK